MQYVFEKSSSGTAYFLCMHSAIIIRVIKMKKYRLVIFDMDGTILYTLEDLRNSVNHALEMHGLPLRSNEEIRRAVGNGIRRLVEKSVPQGLDPELLEQVFSDFRKYYTVHCQDLTRPYEGITDLIRKLKAAGIRCAVVSNKPDDAVQKLNARYFDGLLDAGAGERENVRRKPAPDMVNAVLAGLCMDRNDAVYVGDTEVDLMTARNAGMDCISVLWGFRTEEELAESGAVRMVKSVKELEDMLL